MRYQKFTEQEVVILLSLVARGSSTPGVRDDISQFERKRMCRVVYEILMPRGGLTRQHIESHLGVDDTGYGSEVAEALRLQVGEVLADLQHSGLVTFSEETGIYRRTNGEGDAAAAALEEAARR